MNRRIRRVLLGLVALGGSLILDSCSNVVLLHSQGTIGSQEETIIYVSAGVMLLVVIPVIVMAIVFSRRYRAGNAKAKVDPKWEGSKRLEAVIWIVPVVIVAFLAAISWIYSHSLNPYTPIRSASRPVKVEVVALDWKWLFIYPRQGIATVNKVEFPAHVPVHFYITSATVMNSFFIPRLGSQIMTMPGGQTQLNLEAKAPGTYHGLSSNFSGAGFSGMAFKAVALKNEGRFKEWVDLVRHSGKALTQRAYRKLARHSRYVPVTYYSSVEPKLFHSIIVKNMPNASLASVSTHAGS